MAGIRRAGKDRGRGQVDGLIWQDVERVCVYAETEGTLAGLRDAAMIRLMSDCLLRISEVVAVDIADLKERTLTVRASKTDQEGTGETLYVCDATRNVLNQYRARAGITRGAVFRHIRRGGHVQSDRLTPSPRAESFRNAHTLRAWKVSYLGIPFASGLPSPSHKPGKPSSICRSLVGGNPLKCRRIMPKPNSPNAVRSHGSRTESRDNQDTHRSQVVASGYNTQNVPSTSESTFSAGVTYCLPRVDRNRCQWQHVHRNRYAHPNRRRGFC